MLGTVPPHDAACPTHDNDNILQGWHKLKKDLPISTRSIMWSHHLNLLIPSKHCKFLSTMYALTSCLLPSNLSNNKKGGGLKYVVECINLMTLIN